MSAKVCVIEGCNRRYVARDLCGAHYQRWRKYGDPLGSSRRKTALEKGRPKRCGRCGETHDISFFPSGWSPCKDCRREIAYSKGKRCSVCDVPLTNDVKNGYCRTHWGEYVRANTKPSRHKIGGGYVALTGFPDHPNARARGTILEHVKVMSDHIGRPLWPDENVHHINGVRDDNRIENLELWSTHQPPGQRVADKVAWAKEILARYGDAA